MDAIKLSDGEWKLVKALWRRQPQTLAELVAGLRDETGWSKSTVFMMLKRLIAKGAVTMDDSRNAGLQPGRPGGAVGRGNPGAAGDP